VSDCACSCGGLPVQVVGRQPDQHHRQRDLCRTDSASRSVRHGAVGFLFILGSRCLVGCMDAGAFFAEACFLLQWHVHFSFFHLHKLFLHMIFCMPCTHRFILSSFLVVEYVCVCVYLGLCVCVCVFVCVFACVCVCSHVCVCMRPCV
jgi:hypothetical protein